MNNSRANTRFFYFEIMDTLKQQRVNKAHKYFSKDFIRLAEVDPIAAYVYNQVINGNAYGVIERLTARINEQQATINNLMDMYSPNYNELLNSS